MIKPIAAFNGNICVHSSHLFLDINSFMVENWRYMVLFEVCIFRSTPSRPNHIYG